ncbi:glycoside hydrolase family 97 protein [Candidatus Saccharibacteria bacterium]|nr:glycoside hydrolase family 97 protein [Candidatus Saccharibacteria bacterium]
MFKWANSLISPNSKRSTTFARKITSPNQKIRCLFKITRGFISYEVYHEDIKIIKDSKLGFLFYGEKPLGANLQVVRTYANRHAETITMPNGDTKYIDNHYNEVTFHLAETKPPRRHLRLTFRIFDDAVAFRYQLLPYNHITHLSVKAELTEFNIDQASTVWSIPAYQPDRYEYNYEKSSLATLNHSVHTPLTIKTPSGPYLSIHEAALYDYGAMNLAQRSAHLFSDITPLSDGTKAHIKLPFVTPWRLIMIAENAAKLTKNHTMYALNPAPAGDFSWVKTLKFLGIWWAMYVGEYTWAPGENHGATTKHAIEYIDAAVKLGLQGLLIEGWNNGWEGDWLTNGATTNFTAEMPDFDLEKVANYATAQHIELVGHHETVGFIDNYEKQLESALNFYAKNHIHYLKTGYSGAKMTIGGRQEYHHSQIGVNHYQKVLELAAKKHICLDVHEPIKSTGIERTYPNLLTREGARGQEYESGAIKPPHACILPYTRLLAGGMDYTPGIFDLDNPKKPVYTTITRQLAYFITIYSGMTMAADRPKLYAKYPKLFEFIRHVPTDFELSVPLQGEIGEFFIIARKDRASNNWYVGGVTNECARTIRLPLDFLEPDRKYHACIYQDAPTAHYRTNKFAHEIIKKTVRSTDTLEIYLAPGGGFAIEIRNG